MKENFVTKTVMPDEVQNDMLNYDKIRDLRNKKFVEKRIVKAEEPFKESDLENIDNGKISAEGQNH